MLAADKEFLIEILVIKIASKAIVSDLCSKLCSASEERLQWKRSSEVFELNFFMDTS